MAISYWHEISNGEGMRVIFRLLRRWRGSVYKLLWLDMMIYLVLYYAVNLAYRLLMNDSQKKTFVAFVEFCAKSTPDIPISFLLGFFVSGIAARWFSMYECIPWLDRTALVISAHIDRKDEQRSRAIRLTIMRYINLSWILMMRLISAQISDRITALENQAAQVHQTMWRRKHRLRRSLYRPWIIGNELDGVCGSTATSPMTPLTSRIGVETPSAHFTFDAFHTSDEFALPNMLRGLNCDQKVQQTFGFLITEPEIVAFQNIAADWYNRTKTKYTPEYWVPLQWAQRLIQKALQFGYIGDPKRAFVTLKELLKFRNKMQHFQLFSSVIIPLAYSQVVTIAVFSYFFCQIFSRQFVEHEKNYHNDQVDFYIPVVSVVSFLFLMGWYKVALCVINPFGDDDEDFDVDQLLDHNLEVSYRIVRMSKDSFPTNFNPYGTDSNEIQAFLQSIDIEIEKVERQASGCCGTADDCSQCHGSTIPENYLNLMSVKDAVPLQTHE